MLKTNLNFRMAFIVTTIYALLVACQPSPTPPQIVAGTPSITLTATKITSVSVTPSLQPTNLPSATASATSRPTVTPKPSSTPTPNPTTPPKPSPTPSLDPTTSPQGKVVIGLVGDLTSLNPLTDLNPLFKALNPLLYPTLLTLNPETGAPQANVVALRQIAPDGLTITYTLQVTAFSEVDVGDIQASLAEATWPVLDDMRRVNQRDGDSLLVTLTAANCNVVDRLALLPILPAVEILKDFPTGEGPFVLQTWSEDDNQLKLTGNLDYATPPQLAEITVRLFPDEMSANSALQAGEVDILPVTRFLGEYPPGYTVTTQVAPVLTFVSFNNQDPQLSQVAVRRALSLAVDREKLLEMVYGGVGELAEGMLLTSHWAMTNTLEIPDYAPTEAAALLDSIGLIDTDGDGWRDLSPGGAVWRLTIRAREENLAESEVALFVAAAYRQIGVQARAELVPDYTLLDDLLTHDYQASIFSWPVSPFLDQTTRWHSEQIEAELGANLAAYANAQVDRWLEAARQVPGCDVEGRAALYQQIGGQLATDRPIDFLIHPHTFVVIREGLQGVAPSPYLPFTWNVSDWTWADD